MRAWVLFEQRSLLLFGRFDGAARIIHRVNSFEWRPMTPCRQ
jgi:hypothetical protein